MDITRVEAAPVSPRAHEFFVTMRDGVRLATDVYLGDDAGAEPRPAILIRLPYDKSGEYTYLDDIAEYATARGYVVVAQDVRGKFRSEGETLLFVNEAKDGYDTIDWVSAQPWCDGSVAMWGDSYFGFTQLAAVSSGHPALKAVSPRLTGTRLGERPVDEPGVPVRDVEMGVALMYPLSYFHSNDAFWWKPQWTQRPYISWIESFIDQVGERSRSFDQWYPRPVVLSRFPDGLPFDKTPVPTLYTIGWWDNCAPWSWADHELIQKRPRWAINEYLLIEPIDHENYALDDPERTSPRSAEAHKAVIARTLQPALDFFDVFVKQQKPASDIPRVRWTLAQTGEVRTAEQWPPAGVIESTLFANPDGGLARDLAPVSECTWVHDPEDLVPSSAADAFAFLLEMPDESPVGSHEGVLVFTTEPVTESVDLVGPVRAVARVSSSGPKMDLFVRLLDLRPDGTSLRIARGQVHIRDAAQEQTVTVDMGHLGYRLHAGHSLRVHVSSSDFPEFVAQPGTGEDPFTATTTTPNIQRIATGGADGFRIHLSLSPEAAQTTVPWAHRK